MAGRYRYGMANTHGYDTVLPMGLIAAVVLISANGRTRTPAAVFKEIIAGRRCCM